MAGVKMRDEEREEEALDRELAFAVGVLDGVECEEDIVAAGNI